MIVTVTPNTGIDYTLVVPHLELNHTIRANRRAWGMGGKATDVAWILGKLGVPCLALGFAGGFTGVEMERMLRQRGVMTNFTWVEGETRLNIVVACADGRGQSTITSPGLRVSEEQVQEAMERYLEALEGATCVVLGGSLPQGVPVDFYSKAIRLARAREIPVVFDSSGPALRTGVSAGPTVIKPNRDELAELLGWVPESEAEILRAARQLQEENGCDVIITLGGEGALAVVGAHAYHVPALPLPVSSAAGAGDGILAGLALALSQREVLEKGLRQGAAIAGAVLQTLATADFEVDEMQRLLPQIEILRLEGD